MEVFLKFADFYIVSIHGLFSVVPILVDLVDDHQAVSIDEQTVDTKWDCYLEAMKEGLVLGFIVGSRPEYL